MFKPISLIFDCMNLTSETIDKSLNNQKANLEDLLKEEELLKEISKKYKYNMKIIYKMIKVKIMAS